MSHVCFSCSSRVQRDSATQQGHSRASRRFFREMNVTHSHQRWIGLIAVLIGLTGCSQKPPGCADPEVQTTMRQLLLGEREPGAGSSDPVAVEVLKEIKLSLTNVVSEGYQADARKQSCRATLSVELPGGKSIAPDVVYATQLTVDKEGSFLLTVENAAMLQLALTGGLPKIISERRWGGEWQGEMSCTASTRPGMPQPEAFTERFKAVVKEGGLSAHLSGREGISLASGGISDSEPETFLDSDGREGQPGHTRLMVWLKPNGASLTGKAEYVDMGLVKTGDIIRRCTVSMAKGSAPAGTATPQPVAQLGWPGTYTGEGDGDVTLEVKQQGADKKYPVSLSTNTARSGGGCSGSVTGFAAESGTELRIVAEADGQRCEAVAKRSGNGIELEEGPGCNYFHGAACGFSATLTRKP
jgi:hypothetical protein